MTLYLSRLRLDRAAPSRALAPLLDPHDPARAADAHHRLIWTAFADLPGRPRDFLWRAEGHGRFYVLSARPPKPGELFEAPEVKAFEPDLRPGDRLTFALRANATRDRPGKVLSSGRDRRVDVVMDRLYAVPKGERALHRDAAMQAAAEDWMARQGATKGFRSVGVTAEAYSTLSLGRRRRQNATLGILDLSGQIEIVDPDAFLPAIARGFGRAKAWGCGLMLIRRAPRS